MIYEIINTSGLLLDVAGAYYLASEVTKRFEGEKYKQGKICSGGSMRPVNTDDFDAWEIRHFSKMRRGLILLCVGFALQISTVWHLDEYISKLFRPCFQ
jgi:hypothetical protein